MNPCPRGRLRCLVEKILSPPLKAMSATYPLGPHPTSQLLSLTLPPLWRVSILMLTKTSYTIGGVSSRAPLGHQLPSWGVWNQILRMRSPAVRGVSMDSGREEKVPS
eukprot:Rmarinus@m.5873